MSHELHWLKSAGLEELRARWVVVFSREAPPTFRRAVLAQAIAYRLQVEVHGDVSFGHHNASTARVAVRRPGGPDARLVRTWRGEVYEVEMIDGEFEMKGRRYRSLSAIAREITGTRWNGLTFFGAKERPELSRRQAHG